MCLSVTQPPQFQDDGCGWCLGNDVPTCISVGDTCSEAPLVGMRVEVHTSHIVCNYLCQLSLSIFILKYYCSDSCCSTLSSCSSCVAFDTEICGWCATEDCDEESAMCGFCQPSDRRESPLLCYSRFRSKLILIAFQK